MHIKIKQKLLDSARAAETYDGLLYLVGEKNGVLSHMVKLKKTGGCDYVPAVRSEDLTAATMKLMNSGYKPKAFLKTEPIDEYINYRWKNLHYGTWLKKFPYMPCISLDSDRRSTRQYNPATNTYDAVKTLVLK